MTCFSSFDMSYLRGKTTCRSEQKNNDMTRLLSRCCHLRTYIFHHLVVVNISELTNLESEVMCGPLKDWSDCQSLAHELFELVSSWKHV